MGDGISWGYYVFAKTPHEARHIVAEYYQKPYKELRYSVVRLKTEGESELCDENCDRLKENGVFYIEEGGANETQ